MLPCVTPPPLHEAHTTVFGTIPPLTCASVGRRFNRVKGLVRFRRKPPNADFYNVCSWKVPHLLSCVLARVLSGPLPFLEEYLEEAKKKQTEASEPPQGFLQKYVRGFLLPSKSHCHQGESCVFLIALH